MSAWTNGTYTHKGITLLTKLTQGNSLKITRAVTGTGYVNPDTLAYQTKVTGIKQQLAFKAASYPATGTCKLPMFLTNQGLSTGYKARQIGLYATDPDEGEILYFIAQSSDGTDVPSASEMPEYSATWSFYFRYGQADKVTVNVDPSHTITEDMLKEVRIIAETGVSAPNKGAALALKNTANLPFANLRLFGKTTQGGTPTPDNPVDLTPAGVYAAGSYHHTINISGKNLLNVSLQSGTHSGLTVTVHDDGKIEAKGTSTGGGIYLQRNLILAPGIYTFSIGNAMSLEDGNGIWVYGDGASLFLKKDASGTLNVRKTMSFDVYLFPTVGAEWDVSIYPQIEIGPVATEYEKGKGTQTLAISTHNGLNGIPVSSGGNYTDADGQQYICDEIDLARGVYVQRVQCKVCDGVGGFGLGNHTNGQKYIQLACSGIRINSPLLCDRYAATQWSNENGKIYCSNDTVVMTDSRFTDADTTSAILANEKSTLLYILATPIETPLTSEEVAAFDALHSNNPVTTITNNGDANMEADCFLAQHEAGFKRIINYVQRYLLTQ